MLERERKREGQGEEEQERERSLKWGGASSLNKTLGGASSNPHTTAPSITKILKTIMSIFLVFLPSIYYYK